MREISEQHGPQNVPEGAPGATANSKNRAPPAASENMPIAGENIFVRPFLVWPVARREFYSSISIALTRALIWGVMIFGFRAAEVIVAAVAGAAVAHKLLKRFTRRGHSLLFPHTLVSALVLASLSMAFWPPLVVLAAGIFLTALLWIFQGPGRDRIHPAVVTALALALVAMPLIYQHTQSQPAQDAVLARNRLVMGDITYGTGQPVARWPRSDQIDGHDAVYMPHPLTVLATLIPELHASINNRDAFEAKIDQALVTKLPSIDLLILGVHPGYIGTVSCLGLMLGGLYLGYRNVLRPRSVMLYLAAIVAGLGILSLLPADFAHWTARTGLAALWRSHVDRVLTLQFYQFFSGDVLFAAVIILALPGSEPITPSGRRWMLILAGVATPFIQRLNPSIPVATAILLLLQPLNPLFDNIFARRSWLNP